MSQVHPWLRVVVLASIVGAGAAPPPSSGDAAALATKYWGEVISGVRGAIDRSPSAARLTVENEVLRDNKKTGPRCIHDAIQQCDTEKADAMEALESAINQASRAWARAKGTLKNAPAGTPPPWGDEADAVSRSLKLLDRIYTNLNASNTTDRRPLKTLWDNVKDFAEGLPSGLGTANAGAMIPEDVQVRCLGSSFKVRDPYTPPPKPAGPPGAPSPGGSPKGP